MDSHRSCAYGIWFCCGAVRSFPATTPAYRPRSLSSVLWSFVVVRHRPHWRWSAREPLFRLAQAVATALFLALVGLAMAIYLVSVRGSANIQSQDIEEKTMLQATSKTAPDKSNGITNKASNHSVDQTVEKLKTILQSKGVTLFALVDHSGEAEKVGMKMRPTKLLIFGSPRAGTPLMLASA